MNTRYSDIFLLDIANYIVENKATVRQAAKYFWISKTTVHKHMTKTLVAINPELAKDVRNVLDYNKSQRCSRGGIATSLKRKSECKF